MRNFFPSTSGQEPTAIAVAALEAARRGVYEPLIVDTAGRLHVDDELMREMQAIDRAVAAPSAAVRVDAMRGRMRSMPPVPSVPHSS